MKVYVAGPMTGIKSFNFPAFHKAAAMLREKGYDVENPADTDGGDTSQPRTYYLRKAFRRLLDCDAIYLLIGWEKSEGAKLEASIAHELDMEVWIQRLVEPPPAAAITE